MGADIYLNSTRKRFRNSYNDSDVMWAMGLSWRDTVRPILDADGRLPVQRARELLALIEEHPLTDPWLTEHYVQRVGTGGNEPPTAELVAVSDWEVPEGMRTQLRLPPGLRLGPPIDVWAEFLQKRRDELIAILRKSIELDEPLVCSL
jgi:hypothetical protein